MKQHHVSDAGLLAGSNCLGRTCGTNIDTEGIEFTNQEPNLMYIDKVFSFNEDTTCPILFNLNTGGQNANKYTTELFLEGCGLIPCTLTSNAVFKIEKAFVVVEYFNTRPPGNISAPQVTLDGFPVDSVTYSNGQYTASTANVLPKIQKDQCLDRGLPTKSFFLITNGGPWDFRATYVLEGTVNTNGRNCCFRAEIKNAPDSGNTSLPNGSLSNFSIRNLSLPCSINGVAPDILFQFRAKINLVNPRLVVNCGSVPVSAPIEAVDSVIGSGSLCCCPCPPCPAPINSCTVSLVTTLAVEPVVHVETVRRTLFCVNACEALQPCEGSLVAAEIEENEEDCLIGGIDRPDCQCGNSNVRGVSACRNQWIGGVTVGTGTCEDCVWGRTEGHNCIPNRRNRNDCIGASECIRDKRRTAFQFHSCNGCSW